MFFSKYLLWEKEIWIKSQTSYPMKTNSLWEWFIAGLKEKEITVA